MRPYALAGSVLLGLLVVGWLAGGAGSEERLRRLMHLPEGIPLPRIPDDNPLTAEKIELGRSLFYDGRLSINGRMSCGTCHRQHLAFTDGKGRAVGVTGQRQPRGSMTLANVAYASRLTWAHPLLESLEHQALLPVFRDDIVEMGMGGKEGLVLERLERDPRMVALFEAAFPDQQNPVNLTNVFRALASFERTLNSFNSPYDRYMRGDVDALNASEKRGMTLFLGERLECFHCHGGPTFSDALRHDGQLEAEVAFHNTGLYPLETLEDAQHPGIAEVTRRSSDVGRFKAPTLRNIAVTAPYMHDGSLSSLEEVLEHYESGGRAGDHPHKSVFVSGFLLTSRERQDVLNFLHALTDRDFLTNPALADPNAQGRVGR